MLRPGLQVLRRDVRTLQFGLDWPGVVSLPASSTLDAVLAAVDGHRDVEAVVAAASQPAGDSQQAQALVDLLLDCGILIDQATTAEVVHDRASWAATWLLAGPAGDGRELHRRRIRTRLHVHGTGRVADAARTLLTESELTLTATPIEAEAVILATDHEPDRGAADQLMRDGIPHLWAYVRELVGVVGPFVSPGETGCLRCLDHARTELDPAWSTLVAATTSRRPSPPACDRLLASLVGAWAAQEASLWTMRLQPHSWGGSIELPQGFGPVHAETFATHPRCGCGWSIWHDTMGA